MRHTISVLVENKFGVLTRVAGLFSGRGYNIDTLNVAPTQDPTTSRMTIVTRGDDATVDQIVKQLNKLVNVMNVQDFREGEYVDRELVLVKVAVDSKTRAEVMQITDIFRAKIVDVQPKSLTIEVTGDESKVEKLLSLLKTFGIIELDAHGQGGAAPQVIGASRFDRRRKLVSMTGTQTNRLIQLWQLLILAERRKRSSRAKNFRWPGRARC